MSSGFSGGGPELFAAGGRSTSMNSSYNGNLNPQQKFPFRSPLSGAQIRHDFIGKRSLEEFQQLNQQGHGFSQRNVRLRPIYQHASSPVSQVDFSPVPSMSPEVSSVSNNSLNSRYALPILHHPRLQPSNNLNKNVRNGNTEMNLYSGLDSEKKMMNNRLLELEKELLGDEEEGEAVSDVTNSEWSETIQSLIGPTHKPIAPSPTSSSSSCSSTSASSPIPCTKQSMIDAAVAISEGKLAVAAEILTRLQQVANARGTSEQRLTAYMVSALKSRVNPTEHPVLASELYGKEHMLSTQKLYDVSPCFKLGFMAANLAILEATAEQGFLKIHVVDFDIGEGGQYMHFLHALLAKKSTDKRAAALKITAFTDYTTGCEAKLKIVGERLRTLANEIEVCFDFSVKNLNMKYLNREKLGVEEDEALAVNLAFKLHKMPDESVTTENLRDELLRLVKGLSPTVTTVVEQDMNANTSPLPFRVREMCEHYGALFDSLEATMARANPDRVRIEEDPRVRIEEALGQKMGNSVACEGRERVERCEVLGKWRARMSMAGFESVSMSRTVAESLRVKLNTGTRGNPGFTVKEESGGVCFGWMGRTLTVASAWR